MRVDLSCYRENGAQMGLSQAFPFGMCYISNTF